MGEQPVIPFSPRVKLISIAVGIAAACAFSAYVAWAWSDAIYDRNLLQQKADAKEAQDKAVDDAVKSAQAAIDEERRQRLELMSTVADALKRLDTRVGQIRQEQATIKSNVRAERASNPDFYGQPLPPVGREQWVRARKAAEAPFPASSPTP